MGRESLLEMNSSASENEVFRSHEISETPTTYAIVKTAELGHKMRLACESCCIVKASCSESKHSSFSAVLSTSAVARTSLRDLLGYMQKIGNYALHGNPDEEGIEKVNFRLEEKKYW